MSSLLIGLHDETVLAGSIPALLLQALQLQVVSQVEGHHACDLHKVSPLLSGKHMLQHSLHLGAVLCVLQWSAWLAVAAINHQGRPLEGSSDDPTSCQNNPWSYVSNTSGTYAATRTAMVVESPPLVLDGVGLTLLDITLDGACFVMRALHLICSLKFVLAVARKPAGILP